MRFWNRPDSTAHEDDIDPFLADLISPRNPHHEVNALSFARARARVETRLHHPRGLALGRRLALSGFGAGGLWTSVTGIAAANQAAAVALGASVVLGGAVAETSGIGAAAREAVVRFVTDSPETTDLVASETPAADEAPAHPMNAVAPASTLPGNAVTHLGEDGGFHLRGEVAAVADSVLTLTTAEGSLALDVSGASVQGMGNQSTAPDWQDYVGYGVIASGSCLDGDPLAGLSACTTIEVRSIHVLGRAGQGGQDGAPPEEDATPENRGVPARSGQGNDADSNNGALSSGHPAPNENAAPNGAANPNENAGRGDGARDGPQGVPQNTAPHTESGSLQSSALENAGPPDAAGSPENASPPDDAGPPDDVGPPENTVPAASAGKP